MKKQHFSFLVRSSLVKLETRYTVILPQTVSILSSDPSSKMLAVPLATFQVGDLFTMWRNYQQSRLVIPEITVVQVVDLITVVVAVDDERHL